MLKPNKEAAVKKKLDHDNMVIAHHVKKNK